MRLTLTMDEKRFGELKALARRMGVSLEGLIRIAIAMVENPSIDKLSQELETDRKAAYSKAIAFLLECVSVIKERQAKQERPGIFIGDIDSKIANVEIIVPGLTDYGRRFPEE